MRRATVALLFAALAIGVTTVPAADPVAKSYWVYLGTYTAKDGAKGIYKATFDTTTGKLSDAELVAETANPTFLTISPDRKFLYAVSEVGNFEGTKAGGVIAYAIEPKTGKLTKINAQPTGGGGPCHVAIDKTGKAVVVANYGGGSCASYPIQADGKLGAAGSMIQHKGSSADKGRQEGPHAHNATIDPTNKFAFVSDLGLDQVLCYKLDTLQGKLTPNDTPYLTLPPGSGPRHFAFHPTKPLAFVINELKCTLSSLKYDADKGTLAILDTATTLPRDLAKGDSTAEVVVHPNGKWVYGSNRGHNSIVAFEVADDGKLKVIGHQGEGIKTPRNFNIDPTGQWMLVGNQSGGSVAVFKIDQKTGALTPTGTTTALASPVCIKFVAPVE